MIIEEILEECKYLGYCNMSNSAIWQGVSGKYYVIPNIAFSSEWNSETKRVAKIIREEIDGIKLKESFVLECE